MAKIKKKDPTKRFGPRYGIKIKKKLLKVEKLRKAKHKCPSCRAEKVKRLSSGIWECKKCNTTFVGKAYTVPKEIITQEQEIQEEIEEIEEDEEDFEEEKEKKKDTKNL